MKYIKIPLYAFRLSEYLVATIEQRGTWFSLLVWCCQQENGGIIEGCRSWGDRRWMQSCGVTVAEVAKPCELFTWDGDDLIVFFYPENVHQKVEER